MVRKKNKSRDNSVQHMIDSLVCQAQAALDDYMLLGQEHIDEIIKAMALAGAKEHLYLAKLAVEETGRGILEDKVTKNIFATEYVYHDIKYDKTVGVIEDNEEDGYRIVAEPVGIIAGITPVTNPTSTTLFKSIISVKTRNPIIFCFHPSAQNCSQEAARIVQEAAVKAGAPKNCILWIKEPSLEASHALMNHKSVSMVLATGGSGMVRAAYSTGKPALGVGPGNVPCFIEKSANVEQSVHDLILSKSFDNGMICASEQAAIVEKPVYKEVVARMKAQGCYFATKKEIKKIEPVVIDPKKGSVNPAVVGMSPFIISEMAGVAIPRETKILCCEIDGVGPEHPLSKEKLSPVLGVLKVNDAEEGICLAEKMLEIGGLGHSSVLHSRDKEVIQAFSRRMKTGRIILNSPSTHGAIGDVYNTNTASLTLGCGAFGGNSTTANVSAANLINTKRVAKRRVNMQWFKIPRKIYFEFGSLQYLEKMPNISRAVIVTDPMMVKFGYVDRILHHLRKRPDYVHSKIFSDVEPDPSLETIERGAKVMEAFNPDVIIALGGGSPIDAAKGMWLFFEHPESDFEGMAERFMDIRKRIYKFPKMGNKTQFVAIPTTSGTGSEITSFAVITDKKNNIKYPLADYELTPDVAIIDPSLVMTMPRGITADTGMDVLTHAIEAYVSLLASDFTDGLAIKAIELVFEYLPRAYKDGSDEVAREKMHNASAIAGMSFTNAFLGINHSLAHTLGGEFHIPHGRANAVLLPYVIAYNGVKNPTKFTAFPKYDHYVAHERYADIAKYLHLPCSPVEKGVKELVKAVRSLMKKIGLPASIQECGVEEKEFLARVDYLAERAFEDQCTVANPRLPLVTELAELYRKAYFGK